MEPNWALIACGIAERTDTDLNTVDPTGDPKFPYNILIRNLMLGLQNAYRDGTKNAEEWLPIADAPRDAFPFDGELVLVTGWQFDKPSNGRWFCISRWSAELGHWCACPEDEGADSELYQPTHFQHLPPPPEDAT